MNLTLKVWRQKNATDAGSIESYDAKDIPTEASFLEMLDIVNEGLVTDGKEPIHFDHDCREGICGMCSLTINGVPHSKEMGIFDRIIASGGYVEVRTGSAPDANAIPIPKKDADESFLAAACIGCGACVAACRNGSAMLFVSAKAAHLNKLPQGQPEKDKRVLGMVRQMDEEGFGNCTNQYECEAACPKSISADNIAKLNRDYMLASVKEATV